MQYELAKVTITMTTPEFEHVFEALSFFKENAPLHPNAHQRDVRTHIEDVISTINALKFTFSEEQS